ncbi:MAG: alpha/beta fold hydrolase [Candidatus Kariarchaeaceae archaeon]
MTSENQLPAFINWDNQLTIRDKEGRMNVGVLIPEEKLFSPIVLVHGWLGTGETWGRVAQELVKEGYTVYCPDLLGHGESDKPETIDYDILLFEKYLKKLIQEEIKETVILGGHSMGGAVSMLLTDRNKELVKALFLVSTAYTFRQRVPKFVVEYLPDILINTSKELLNKLINNFWKANDHEIEKSIRGRIVQNAINTPTYVAKSTYEKIILKWNGKELVKTINIPAIVATGSIDFLTTPRMGKALMTKLPLGVFRQLKGVGHQLPISKPRELAELVKTYLK